MLYREITEKIIGAAMNIYTIPGFGFMEKVYENALIIELELLGLKTIQQYPIKVFYKGNIVGDKIIIELKSIENLTRIHEVQLVNYLKAINKEVGILLNFGKEKLEFKRKVLNL